MNKLTIENRVINYKGNDGKEHACCQAEFIVDGKSLSDIFEFSANRPWFGRTFFEEPELFKNNELKAILGEKKPENQFDTNRFVLYRCHCGCDYCGVISCLIERDGDSIKWNDIRYEDDDNETSQHTISGFQFSFAEYAEIISSFFENTKKSSK